MSVLEWVWLATLGALVVMYLLHFAQAVLPEYIQALLSYGHNRKGTSVFADVPKRY